MGLRRLQRELSICAVIAVRNEHDYLVQLLPRLQQERIDVAIIDNDSTDDTSQLLREYADAPVVDVVRQPWDGHFSLSSQLAAKDAVIAGLDHDWVIHQDADELLTGRDGVSLRSTIERAHENRYNVLNFEEFVFVPTENSWDPGGDYEVQMDRYYFFAPQPVRLNRAWKRGAATLSPDHGGHLVTGKRLRMDPVNHDLRHYIALSVKRLNAKYGQRVFAPDEVDRGWHRNRVDLFGMEIRVDLADPRFATLGSDGLLSRESPVTTHFWEWQ